MPAVHERRANKDYKDEGIKKGDKYYTWKLRHGPVMRSKKYPKRSQLTSSEFLSTLYDLEDSVAEFKADNYDDLISFCEDICGQIQELRDGCQDRLDNMPEGLQQGSTGELLQERIDALEGWESDIDNLKSEFETYKSDAEDEDADKDSLTTVEDAIQQLQDTSCGL